MAFLYKSEEYAFLHILNHFSKMTYEACLRLVKRIASSCCALLFILLFAAPAAHAQTNQWTWLKGNNTGSQTGTYGTQGVANAANTPGARNGQSMVMDARRQPLSVWRLWACFQ